MDIIKKIKEVKDKFIKKKETTSKETGKNPKLETEMATQYFAWVEKNGIMDWDQALPRLLAAWNMKTVNG